MWLGGQLSDPQGGAAGPRSPHNPDLLCPQVQPFHLPRKEKEPGFSAITKGRKWGGCAGLQVGWQWLLCIQVRISESALPSSHPSECAHPLKRCQSRWQTPSPSALLGWPLRGAQIHPPCQPGPPSTSTSCPATSPCPPPPPICNATLPSHQQMPGGDSCEAAGT